MIKNVLRIMVFVALVTAVAIPVGASTLNNSGMSTPGTPIIDGEIDEVWETANVLVAEKWKTGGKEEPGKVAMQVRTLWDDNYLYVLAEVTDPDLTDMHAEVWQQDSIEVYLDEDNKKTSKYEEFDVQYRINFNNFVTTNNVDASMLISETKIVEDGYIVELAMPFQLIYPEVGVVVGFDFQVNNSSSETNGTRTSMLSWSDFSNNAWQSTAVFGNLTLGAEGATNADIIVAPEPTKAPDPTPTPEPTATPEPTPTPEPAVAETAVTTEDATNPPIEIIIIVVAVIALAGVIIIVMKVKKDKK